VRVLQEEPRIESKATGKGKKVWRENPAWIAALRARIAAVFRYLAAATSQNLHLDRSINQTKLAHVSAKD
jgi:hypothetical protein